jgi:XisI protein
MDTVSHYRKIIEQVLRAHTETPSSTGDVQCQTVFDEANDHYLLLQVGWGRQKRVYGVLAHIDLIGEKIWIQHDSFEAGLANQLHAAGIRTEHIVLGYRIPEVRKHTGYAVA